MGVYVFFHQRIPIIKVGYTSRSDPWHRLFLHESESGIASSNMYVPLLLQALDLPFLWTLVVWYAEGTEVHERRIHSKCRQFCRDAFTYQNHQERAWTHETEMYPFTALSVVKRIIVDVIGHTALPLKLQKIPRKLGILRRHVKVNLIADMVDIQPLSDLSYWYLKFGKPYALVVGDRPGHDDVRVVQRENLDGHVCSYVANSDVYIMKRGLHLDPIAFIENCWKLADERRLKGHLRPSLFYINELVAEHIATGEKQIVLRDKCETMHLYDDGVAIGKYCFWTTFPELE